MRAAYFRISRRTMGASCSLIATDRLAAGAFENGPAAAQDREPEIERPHAKIGELIVEQDHADLSIRQQCRLLGIARSGVYRPPRPANDNDLGLIRRLDELPTAAEGLLDKVAGARRRLAAAGHPPFRSPFARGEGDLQLPKHYKGAIFVSKRRRCDARLPRSCLPTLLAIRV
jgi:putative transposase